MNNRSSNENGQPTIKSSAIVLSLTETATEVQSFGEILKALGSTRCEEFKTKSLYGIGVALLRASEQLIKASEEVDRL